MKINIIIPCFNEVDNLLPLREKFLHQLDKYNHLNVSLVLVDNGSYDGSKEILSKKNFGHPNILITTLKKNIGYGAGIKHGLEHSNADVYSWAHADLQTPMEDIFKTILIAISTNNLITSGIRDSSLLQRIQSRIFDFFISIILNCNIKDINAQPKIFPDKYKVYFISDTCPNDFSLDMYYFKVFSELSQKIYRNTVKFNPREYGEAKGAQGSLMTRATIFWKMIKMAKHLRNIQLDNC